MASLFFSIDSLPVFMGIFVFVHLMNGIINGKRSIWLDKATGKASEWEIFSNLDRYFNKTGVRIVYLNALFAMLYMATFLYHRL